METSFYRQLQTVEGKMSPQRYFLENKNGILLYLIFFLILHSFAFAQSGTIRGKVFDEASNNPLAGANIIIEGTTLGAATDLNGNFVIRSIPAGQMTIVISYIGYERISADITVNANRVTEQNFSLSPTYVEGETVVITAQAEGQMSAIQQQLTSNKIVNIVSEARIQELPDFNAAQALARLPGVSTLKSSGEDNKVVIRGLAPQYNAIEVGGVKLGATGSTQIGATSQVGGGAGNVSSDRSVDLSLITPYMIKSIAVYKALTPEMNANALGGLVNIELREAPSGFRSDLLWQSGYTQKSGEYGNYRTVVSASNRFFNDRLGAYVLLNAESYDRNADNMTAGYRIVQHYRGENRFSDVAVDNVQLSRYIENRRRYGANLILDYPLPKGSIKSVNMFARLRSDFNDHRMALNYTTNNINFNYREGVNNIDMAMNSLKFEYDLGRVLVDVTAANTYSRNNLPEAPRLNYLLAGGIVKVGETPRNTVPEDLTQFIAFEERGGADQTVLTQIDLYSSKYKEDNRSVNANFTIPFALSTSFTGYFKTGGIFRYEKHIMDQETPYVGMGTGSDIQLRMMEALQAEFGVSLPGGQGLFPASFFTSRNSDLYKTFLDDKFGRFLWAGDPTIPVGFVRYLSAHREEFYGQGSGPEGAGGWFDGPFQQLANDYKYTERYYATYLMTELNFLNFMVVGGVRYELDKSEFFAYNMVDVRNPPTQTWTETTVYPKNEFWLPMAQVRYKPVEWGDVRYAYTQTLARPDYHMLSPRVSFSYDQRTLWTGNPDLKPAHSLNHDLIFTIYSNRLGLFSIGGYYKTISDFSYYTQYQVYEEARMRPGLESVESITAKTGNSPQVGAILNTYINTPYDATVKGLEVDFQTRLWYLPGLLHGIVLGVNYTMIESKTTYPWRDTFTVPNPNPPPRNIPDVLDSTRTGRLINQPDNIMNAYIGYDYRGFSTRVSYTFIENAVSSVGRFDEQDGFTRDYHRFDFSARQRLPFKGLEIYLDVNNLNSATTVSAQKTIGGFTNQQLYGLTANLGFRLRL
jgi:TonB-dependent receptor